MDPNSARFKESNLILNRQKFQQILCMHIIPCMDIILCIAIILPQKKPLMLRAFVIISGKVSQIVLKLFIYSIEKILGTHAIELCPP